MLTFELHRNGVAVGRVGFRQDALRYDPADRPGVPWAVLKECERRIAAGCPLGAVWWEGGGRYALRRVHYNPADAFTRELGKSPPLRASPPRPVVWAKVVRRPEVKEDMRENADLDAFFAEPLPEARKADESTMRHNPELEAVFGL